MDYNSFPGGSDITVSSGSTQTASPDDYDKLEVEDNATLILSSGNYYFKKEVIFKNGATLSVSGSDVVRLYTKEEFTVEQNGQINIGGTEGQLFVYSRKKCAFWPTAGLE